MAARYSPMRDKSNLSPATSTSWSTARAARCASPSRLRNLARAPAARPGVAKAACPRGPRGLYQCAGAPTRYGRGGTLPVRVRHALAHAECGHGRARVVRRPRPTWPRRWLSGRPGPRRSPGLPGARAAAPRQQDCLVLGRCIKASTTPRSIVPSPCHQPSGDRSSAGQKRRIS